MKRFLSLLFLIGLLFPITAHAQEKSITLNEAFAVVKQYYEDDYFEKDFWLLSERTGHWEIFVDEVVFADWGHDCTIYKFPNTGDPAVDIVPEIIKPDPPVPPNEELEAVAVHITLSGVLPGELADRMAQITGATHVLTITDSELNEADFQVLNDNVFKGRLGKLILSHSVVLENNAIPELAFCCVWINGSEGLNMLQHIMIPDGVETIGACAFKHCDFETMTFPASVKFLGLGSCDDWRNVKWIYSKAVTPPVCEEGAAFAGLTPASTPIYVPVGSAEAYRTAPGWDYFTTFIETDQDPSAGIDRVETGGSWSRVYRNGDVLVIEGAESVEYEIYTIVGRKAKSGVVVGNQESVVLPKGAYIVKVGSDIHKVI